MKQIENTKQVVLLNVTQRTFNGFRPGRKVAVPMDRVPYYLENGFERVDMVLEAQREQEQAEIDALNSDMEKQAKADSKASKQAKTQEQLDAEYEAKKTADELPPIPGDDDLDGEDLGEDLGDGSEATIVGEKSETAPADDTHASDLDALNSELDAKAPAKRK